MSTHGPERRARKGGGSLLSHRVGWVYFWGVSFRGDRKLVDSANVCFKQHGSSPARDHLSMPGSNVKHVILQTFIGDFY